MTDDERLRNLQGVMFVGRDGATESVMLPANVAVAMLDVIDAAEVVEQETGMSFYGNDLSSALARFREVAG